MDKINSPLFENNIMLYLLLLVMMAVIVVLFQSCTGKNKVDKEKIREVLINTDREFSALSNQIGQKESFLRYMAHDAVLLRDNSLPLEGKQAIKTHYETFSDSVYTLSWEPNFADVSESGDLGYTYGTYQLEYKTEDKTIEGTYVSIWKKQPDGSWLWVLDSGNTGLSEK